jgi:predicted N-acetyltransferase YhbS
LNLIIRREKPDDRYAAEYMTKKAFWNLHVPGCSEHYLVHKLRRDAAYLPLLSRVAESNGQVVGAIYYARAFVQNGDERTEVLTFGPLAVEPSFQKQGVGSQLLETTMDLARQAGWKAILIYGEPEYYPKHGFITCDHFGITTPDGKNFPAFQGIELVSDGLKGISGQFHEPDVYSHLPQWEVDQYDRLFPYLEKRKLPGQWTT